MEIQEMRIVRRIMISHYLKKGFTLQEIKLYARQKECEYYGEELRAYELTGDSPC